MRRLIITFGILAMLTGAAAAASNFFFFVGSPGGGIVSACTNQLVLDYSNSCALIGQGWGE